VSLILDASVTMAWYFKDEATPASEKIFDHVIENGAFVPPLWRLEIINAFQVGIRRNRTTILVRDESLADLQNFPITVDHDTNDYIWSTTLRLSDRYGITIYDACYLELAQRRNLPLATFDAQLRSACHSLGLPSVGS